MKTIFLILFLIQFSEMVIFAKYRDLPLPSSFYLKKKLSKTNYKNLVKKAKQTYKNNITIEDELVINNHFDYQIKNLNYNLKKFDDNSSNLIVKKIKYKKIDSSQKQKY